mgnify:FL=1
MKITVLCVGRRSQEEYIDAMQTYTKRLQTSYKLSWDLLASSALEPSKAKQIESDVIRAKLKPNDIVWLLDERGQQISSIQLSNKLQTLKNTGISRLVIIIGGAYGVDESLRNSVTWQWSLSKLVFPHQMVRLILAEQLYRADQIDRGSAYHHA